MSTESHDEIQFLASLPPSAGAIAIDGGDHEGGRLKLDIPGTELAALLRLTMFRGRVLLVTIAPQQAVLPLAAPEDEPPAFPQNPLFQDPLATQAARVVGPEIVSVVVADIASKGPIDHAIRSSIQGPITVAGTQFQRPRRVRRGLVAKGTRRKKAKA